MFGNLFASLKADNNNEPENVKREFSRRDQDHCIVMIDGQAFPVQNWSMGGTLIHADERMFGVDDEFGVTMKFKVGEDVRDITQLARVVRKSRGKIAFQFAPLNGKSRTDFQHVLNDCISSQFADSQSA
mgnify:CR=1 FL=1|jgi:hypothetical protein